MPANNVVCVSRTLDWPHQKPHDFATLELARRAPSPSHPGTDPGLPHTINTANDTMTWTPSATCAHVVAMVARYVRLEFSIRSGVGRMAIDESRAGKPRKFQLSDLDDLSEVETLDLIRTTMVRQAVYSKPEAPRYLSTDLHGGEHVPIRRVVPIRDAAPVVKLKSHLGGAVAPQASAREWRATVAQKIARARAGILVTVEQLRQERKEKRNQLAAVERTARRLKNGGKNASHLRKEAEGRAAALRAEVAAIGERISTIARTRDYRDAPERLLALCTTSQEVETYLLLRDE